MAPNKIASAFSQMLMVSSGKGLPVFSMAKAPTRALLKVNMWLNSIAIAFKTLTACAVTSGPIPSPGKTAIFSFI